jgi:tRNA-Thr(GGU) m(6)t(6)A37 methyltransferase TsaA
VGNEAMSEKITERKQRGFDVFPIGKVRKTKNGFNLEIFAPFRPALRQLDRFSHVIVVWWAHKHDNEESHSKTQTQPPYADKLTGVFACRAEYRPNPLAITTCKILEVDEQNGIVRVPWIDACSNTPIVDLKAYFPVCDRIKHPHIPEWLQGWPEWMPEEMDFESDF